MVVFDLDKIIQDADGRDLLISVPAEHERLVWELEYLAKETQSDDNSDVTNRLNLIKTQILLFERLIIGEEITSLVMLVNHYVDVLSKSCLEIRKATPNELS